MKYLLCVTLMALLAVAGAACSRGDQTNEHETGNRPAATREIDTHQTDKPAVPEPNPGNPGVSEADEEPLLLLEEPEDTDNHLPPPQGPVADNSRCYVCHLNYEADALATVHARNNVGCETCHHDSYAHCSDEDNITPPDVMYAADQINPACMECHSQLSEEHEPVLAGLSAEKYCTDCHGFDEHRLAYRTRRWDKKTGKLIMSDNVRMTTDHVPKKQ